MLINNSEQSLRNIYENKKSVSKIIAELLIRGMLVMLPI